jgi:hypothetical protein
MYQQTFDVQNCIFFKLLLDASDPKIIFIFLLFYSARVQPWRQVKNFRPDSNYLGLFISHFYVALRPKRHCSEILLYSVLHGTSLMHIYVGATYLSIA